MRKSWKSCTSGGKSWRRKCNKFVFVGVKISRQQEVFLTEERPYPHLLLHRSAGPALPQPVDNLLRNVETLVQRHSCLRSLTSWAKCLRNAPCQCTAHATARVDIRLFKSENFPSYQNIFSQQRRNSNKK